MPRVLQLHTKLPLWAVNRYVWGHCTMLPLSWHVSSNSGELEYKGTVYVITHMCNMFNVGIFCHWRSNWAPMWVVLKELLLQKYVSCNDNMPMHQQCLPSRRKPNKDSSIPAPSVWVLISLIIINTLTVLLKQPSPSSTQTEVRMNHRENNLHLASQAPTKRRIQAKVHCGLLLKENTTVTWILQNVC